MFNYETAAARYVELRKRCEQIDREAQIQKAALQKIMVDIESWFTAKAKEDGFTTVTTAFGTAYWSTHHTVKVANPSAFRNYAINNMLYDLLETRASKPAVLSYIKAHNEAPPGIDFSSYRVFNLREAPAA